MKLTYIMINTMPIDETHEEIISLEDERKYNGAVTLSKWIVKNAKTFDGKVSGYFRLVE